MRNEGEIVYPKDAEEYWFLAEKYKEVLLRLIEKYHPYYLRKHAVKITVPLAESIRERAAREIAETERIEPPAETFKRCLREKSADIVDVLQDTWFGMPESTSVREEEGFGLLCDFCSECYVLEEKHNG